MGREPVNEEILGLRVTSQPLPFARAQELLPDALEFVALVGRGLGPVLTSGVKGTDDVIKLLPLMEPGILRQIMAALTKHAAAILHTTTVVMGGERLELMNEKSRNAVFDEHPQAFVPLVVFAGKVTFARFFPAVGQPDAATPTASS